MDASLTHLAVQFVSDPLIRQRIEGIVRLRFWAQALDLSTPATWALCIRLVSRDGKEERGKLLPLTIGTDGFASELALRTVGPLRLAPVDAFDGDRIVVELGSRGQALQALIETRDDSQTWVEFSTDILFEDLRVNLEQKRESRKIGKCIYCGRTDEQLSVEHIIPKGLNGQWTLTDASCSRCRDITSQFENDLLRNAFGPARVALRMRTRRPEERLTHLPVQIRRAGAKVEIFVPVEEYPAVVALPIFAPPAHVTGRSYLSGIELVDTAYTQLCGPPLAELHRKYGYEYTGIRLEYQPMEFARAIAKIAYGFAVLKLGLERITRCYVIPAVLG